MYMYMYMMECWWEFYFGFLQELQLADFIWRFSSHVPLWNETEWQILYRCILATLPIVA